jgi:hypothetical protein
MNNGLAHMNFELILRVLSVLTVSLIVILGLMLLSGFLIPPAVPERLRLMMGTLMLVYGAYRIWVLWMKRPKPTSDDDNDAT